MKIDDFGSREQYVCKKSDIDSWMPLIEELAAQHELEIDSSNAKPGFNATYPVFVVGSLVFKFFGFRETANEVFRSECQAHEVLAKDEMIPAPRILYSGTVPENEDWNYTISTTVEGSSLLDLSLTESELQSLAYDLGAALGKVHALPCEWSFDESFWNGLDVVGAARKSVLPEHLIDQVADFFARRDPFETVFTNADIVENHVFLKDRRLSGIIDWGDAALADRHYELGKLHLNVFDSRKDLLRKFLDGSNWPVSKNFARQSMTMALYRQAVGHTQHHSFDVFYKVPQKIRLEEIETLDELSRRLFEV